LTTFWRPLSDGVSVAAKVQPKSRKRGILGRTMAVHGPCLCIGVNEAAEDGRANRAACFVLSKALHIPNSAVAVTLGHTSRDKILHVDGDTAVLTAKLEAL
jgi:uncharacterized protein YggU (UPF0235/DUF167 family)